ncbi:MATE family efflux transporter [Tsuneonella mangrovi]|uniref:MATE family efflux transporter n=1 Tax=Tsuneonella mangrovi TaxID=1982042 RepID=UPI000BA20CC7|nr:MATE family efflux transporter [Tsuneonella mangrovi]
MSASTGTLTRKSIFSQAWPIIVGQASVPLVGIVDTFVIGRTGDAVALAGVALGSVVVTFIFWAFGFLRMGITGLTAQAVGAEDQGETNALLVRGVATGLCVGLILTVLQWPLAAGAFALLAGSEQLTDAAHGYVTMRFFGAPAALAGFAVLGWLFGIGRTRAALTMQLVMNIANIGLDIAFVWGLGWGAKGVAAGTAIAEWIALGTGIAIALRIGGLGAFTALRGDPQLFARAALRRLFAVNFDIMVRTLALLFLFAWFANGGARLGTIQLAANAVLNQFIAVAAYVLDGFAFTAEARVGAALARGSMREVLHAIRLTGEFSLAAGLAFAVVIFAVGSGLVALMTTNRDVQEVALTYLPFAALVPLLGVPAWLLDGVFIGATWSRAFRNAAIAATALYVVTDLALRPLGAAGLWTAMLVSYLYRAGALGIVLPARLRSIEPDP